MCVHDNQFRFFRASESLFCKSNELSIESKPPPGTNFLSFRRKEAQCISIRWDGTRRDGNVESNPMPILNYPLPCGFSSFHSILCWQNDNQSCCSHECIYNFISSSFFLQFFVVVVFCSCIVFMRSLLLLRFFNTTRSQFANSGLGWLLFCLCVGVIMWTFWWLIGNWWFGGISGLFFCYLWNYLKLWCRSTPFQ